jgi:hypothetical protein
VAAAGGERFTPSTPAARIAANIEVLEQLDDLQTMGRRATPDEQAVLATWSGWGAAPAIFDEADADTAEARGRVQALMSEEDWGAARRTVLNAHYTDPAVAGAMWAALTGLGFGGGRVLEPGCGSGNLIAYAPPAAVMTGVERDPSTAAVAQALYPDAGIHAGPFEQFAPPNPFDAVIANVPFAEPRAFEPTYARSRRRFTCPGWSRAEPALPV